MFVRRSLIWCGIGAAAGLAAAVAVSRLMSALLFEISPLDPLTYSLVAAAFSSPPRWPAICRRAASPA